MCNYCVLPEQPKARMLYKAPKIRIAPNLMQTCTYEPPEVCEVYLDLTKGTCTCTESGNAVPTGYLIH